MGGFDQSYSSASPLLVMSPQIYPHHSFMMGSSHSPFGSPFGHGSNPQPSSSTWAASTSTSFKSATPSGAGRKRSRDEAAQNLCEDEYFPVQAPIAQVQPENEDEWEYSEGMVLIKPNHGYVPDATSQTGTWAEEKFEQEKAKAQPILSSSPERPILRPNKSQRLNLTATPSIAEEVNQNGMLTAPVASSPERSTMEPTIDDFTRHLGIGWSLISADEDTQAAARGWTKFIENHYSVTNAKIVLQSKGLASYLVETNQGYFLFGNDLKQGRLVSINLEKVWANLRGAVPLFDDEMIMEAGDTPKMSGSPAPMTIESQMEEVEVNSTINGGQQPTHALEVEMDMS